MLKRTNALIITFVSISIFASQAQVPWNQCARNHTLPKMAMHIDFSGDEAIATPVRDTDKDESILREMAKCEACCCLVQTHVATKIRNKYWNAKQQCFNPLPSLAVVLKTNGDVEEAPNGIVVGQSKEQNKSAYNLRVEVPTSPMSAGDACTVECD